MFFFFFFFRACSRFNRAALSRARNVSLEALEGSRKEASIGPRSRERGMEGKEGKGKEGEGASIGPRSRERGMLHHGTVVLCVPLLQ